MRKKRGMANNRLSLLLQCVCPFKISEEDLTKFDQFMNPFWAYNNYTAKQTKSRQQVMRLNKMIKQIVFDDINQSEIDTSEVEKKLALDPKIDTVKLKKKWH